MQNSSFLTSLTSSWPASPIATVTAPLKTTIYSSPSVSSVIPAVITSSPSLPHSNVIPWWAESRIADALDPYTDVRGEPYFTQIRRETLDPSIYSSCELVWRTSFSQWLSTSIEQSTLLDRFTCYNTGKSYEQSSFDCLDAAGDDALITTFWSEASSFRFTASSPCCGGCTFTAGNVQVYRWPVTTVSPQVTMVTNTNNFTLYASPMFTDYHLTDHSLTRLSTYPSVYVAFETIGAKDLCGSVGSPGRGVTTIGFDPTDLSTAPSYYPASSATGYGENNLMFISSQSWWSYSAIDVQTRYGF
jgi:hypothetical protein